MWTRSELALTLLRTCLLAYLLADPAEGCAPCGPLGRPVVNADQTVIILWDAANRTQHFIRQASFRSEADDFGFLVPSPSEPELEESGDHAFSHLQRLTEPVVEGRYTAVPQGGLGCGATFVKSVTPLPAAGVMVLQDKMVAGFHAVVLAASSAGDLIDWLKEHGYAYSPQIEEWARPYVDGGWKFTALKIAKRPQAATLEPVAARTLRMSFQTDRPLFPYREPDSASLAGELTGSNRVLRIYFLAEAIYSGALTPQQPWLGGLAWADKLHPEAREDLLRLLGLPLTIGPQEFWLTEFEHFWPYAKAPADVYFSRSPDQRPLHRRPIIVYVFTPWPGLLLMAAIIALPILVRRLWRRSRLASGPPVQD